MKKHTNTDASTRNIFSRSYTAEPRIIDSWFFLREEWKISNSIFSLVDTIDIHRFLIPVCPHLRIIRGGVWLSRRCKEAFGRISKHARAITGLEDGIESALVHPGQWISVSCPRCPTDCDIKVSKGLNKVKVMAWHDFGIEGPPLDGGWEAHVESGSYTDWLTPGPTLADRNSSVRNIWSDSARIRWVALESEIKTTVAIGKHWNINCNTGVYWRWAVPMGKCLKRGFYYANSNNSLSLY